MNQDAGWATWFIVLCFVLAAAGVIGLLIWATGSLALRIRDAWRKGIWDRATALYQENPRAIEDYLAMGTFDLIERYGYEHEPVEIPAEQRLLEMTQEEALRGMLSHAAEHVRLAVENRALLNDLTLLREQLAHETMLRQRHWRSLRRLRDRLRVEEESLAGTPPRSLGTQEMEHHE